MLALKPKLRRDLEKTIVTARNVVVASVEASFHELTVHEGKRGSHLSESDAELRNRLRAHGRQVGDRQNSQTGAQKIDRLVQECAYEQWHRMIFVRFLAENELLIEPELGVAVSMEGLNDIAEESGEDPWELGAQFAAQALPAIFRPGDPLLQVKLSRETRMQLEELLEGLPDEVFTADDSLGWVYQFWQSEEKDLVNKEGAKITGRTLPAVTQLFTEHYMVLFLLHNTIGAWHAGKVLANNPELAENAKDEDELRRGVALDTADGYEFEYLRFVRDSRGSLRDPNADDDTDDRGAISDNGPWRPMGGTFPGWPSAAAALKVLDPSCGSGHFLVATLELLARLRMHEESLSIKEAVESVIRDNLFGLEIDPRCTQIAAFNIAMAAWKLTGPGLLPPMHNIACSGIPLGNSRDDWMKALKWALAGSNLGFQWGQLYDMFSNADTLGSLINPQRFFGGAMLKDEQLDQLSAALTSEIASDPRATREQLELAAAAQGLTRATELLSGKYDLVITNVPYLGRGKQSENLKKHLETQYGLGKADLATAFVMRCLEFCNESGSTALVTPQNWLFLTTYKKMREALLMRRQWNFVSRLGAGAFETIGGEVVNVALLGITGENENGYQQMSGIDVSSFKQPAEKAAGLRGEQSAEVVLVKQTEQLENPNAVITLNAMSRGTLLSTYVQSIEGLTTGDMERFVGKFWEQVSLRGKWAGFVQSVDSTCLYGARSDVVLWDSDKGALRANPSAHNFPSIMMNGHQVLGKGGMRISQMSGFASTIYLGEVFGKNGATVVPHSIDHLPSIWCFVTSERYGKLVRSIDQSLKVTNATLAKVPFDLEHWQKVAAEKYPNGLPEPESDDPTQWLFHGRPEASTEPLQVAVARLLGYRWPAELDSEMRLSDRARELVARCSELDEFIDEDGIACIPSVRGEDRAADRLLRILNAAGVSHSEDLDKWLRTKFFQQHCTLFHGRPFIWHIWDGHKDGFSALVNYHKLAGPSGNKLLESLTYSYLGDWITRQEAAVKADESGADARLIAAKELQQQLIAILAGEPPYDIFVRWKPLHEQPIGWTPDINDGVRMNIRPFMAVDLDSGRKGAGILRYAPKIKWKKDRGKEPKRPFDEYPWFWGWDESPEPDFAGGDNFTGQRWNDLHYTAEAKQAARDAAQQRK